MSARVAINGFGRIGRLTFRQLFDTEGMEIVAINASKDVELLAHLLKYDSTQGRYKYANEVSFNRDNDTIIVKDKVIKVTKERDASKLPWKEMDIDLVMECTGAYTSKEKSMAHIEAGAKRVIISAPGGNDIKTIVYNVNHDILTKDDQIISTASCTTNCLAPLAAALDKLAPIESGIVNTIHAYTSDQQNLDNPHKKGDLRRSRASALNIVPATTGAAKAIGLVLPHLNGKLIGSAQRVPTPTGSTTILCAVVEGEVSVDQVNAHMKAMANETFGYNDDPIVSSDVIGMSYGSLFDSTQTMVTPLGHGRSHVQVVSWYDNENSYVSQMVRTAKYFAHIDAFDIDSSIKFTTNIGAKQLQK
ncbi:MAG: type I glyceraldehyde-3-phosphate dehydrogenase [Parasporobacterium sp.]|nr:type I glyceraldehyde-3-phosphate dehydrogenase [Parasporobacterium sp.]